VSNDFFDETFADLDKFYPGSKRARREPVAPKIKENTGWEDEAYEKHLPNGEKIEMYTLGSLAKALNRPVKTVRYWIEHGQFPVSPYRLPSTVGKNGKEYAGRRLYSRAMVEATIDIFAKAGLLETDRVDWTVHRNLGDKIAEAWTKIRAEENKTTN
jgi:hypothetical protein